MQIADKVLSKTVPQRAIQMSMGYLLKRISSYYMTGGLTQAK